MILFYYHHLDHHLDFKKRIHGGSLRLLFSSWSESNHDSSSQIRIYIDIDRYIVEKKIRIQEIKWRWNNHHFFDSKLYFRSDEFFRMKKRFSGKSLSKNIPLNYLDHSHLIKLLHDEFHRKIESHYLIQSFSKSIYWSSIVHYFKNWLNASTDTYILMMIRKRS